MQPWIFIGETDAEAETPILWPLSAKSQLIGKDPDARIDWRQEEKGATEDETVGWHQLNGHKFEQTPGDREAWHTTVHGFTKSWTWLSDWTTATTIWSRNTTMPVNSFWICNQRKWNRYLEEIPVFSYSSQHYLQYVFLHNTRLNNIPCKNKLIKICSRFLQLFHPSSFFLRYLINNSLPC